MTSTRVAPRAGSNDAAIAMTVRLTVMTTSTRGSAGPTSEQLRRQRSSQGKCHDAANDDPGECAEDESFAQDQAEDMTRRAADCHTHAEFASAL